MRLLKKLVKGVMIFFGAILALIVVLMIIPSSEKSQPANEEQTPTDIDESIEIITENNDIIESEISSPETENASIVSVEELNMIDVQLEDYLDNPQLFIDYYGLEPSEDNPLVYSTKIIANDIPEDVSDEITIATRSITMEVVELDSSYVISSFDISVNLLQDSNDIEHPKMFYWAINQEQPWDNIDLDDYDNLTALGSDSSIWFKEIVNGEFSNAHPKKKVDDNTGVLYYYGYASYSETLNDKSLNSETGYFNTFIHDETGHKVSTYHISSNIALEDNEIVLDGKNHIYRMIFESNIDAIN